MADNDIFIPSVRPRTYLQYDNASILQGLKVLRDDQERAAQQGAALTNAMGQLRNMVNPAEYSYMTDRSQQITDTVNSMVNEGNYTGAIKYAQQAAADMVSDPAIQDRIKANKDYEDFIKRVQDNNKLTEDVKEWAIANNPYYYNDVHDNNGRIVGGSKWKPTSIPVDTIPLASLSQIALQWVQTKHGGGSKTMFYKTDGTLTDTYDKDVAGVAWQTSGTWQYRGPEMLRQALQAAIESTPGAKESLHQDYEVAKWKYNRLSDDEKNTIVGNDIIDSNGRMYTENEYFEKRIQPWLTAAQINNSDYRTTYSDGIAKMAELRAQRQAAQQEIADAYNKGLDYTKFATRATSITYDNTDDYIKAKGVVNTAIDNISKAMPLLAQKDSWKNAVADRDYKKLIKLINTTVLNNGQLYKDAINPYNKNVIAKELTNVINNYKWLEASQASIPRQDLDAVELNAAVDAGIELPPSTYSKVLYKALDDINNGNGKNATTFGISFTSREQLDDMLTSLNMTREDLTSKNISIRDKADNVEIRIDKTNPNIFKILAYIGENRNSIGSIWSTLNPFGKEPELVTYNQDGSELSRQKIRSQDVTKYHGQGTSSYSERTNPLASISHVLSSAEVKREELAQTTGGGFRITNTMFSMPIPEIQAAAEQYGVDSEQYNRVKNNILQGLYSGMMHADYVNGKVFGISEDTNTLVSLSNEDKQALWADLATLIQENRVDVALNTDGVLHGYEIVVVPKEQKKGTTIVGAITKPTKYFIQHTVSSPEMDRFLSDSKTVAIGEYGRRKLVQAPYVDSYNNVLEPINDTFGRINGIEYPKAEIVRYLERDNSIDRVVNHSRIQTLVYQLKNVNNLVGKETSYEDKVDIRKAIENQLTEEVKIPAMAILNSQGVIPPNPNDLNDPVNDNYNVELNRLIKIIIDKAKVQ